MISHSSYKHPPHAIKLANITGYSEGFVNRISREELRKVVTLEVGIK